MEPGKVYVGQRISLDFQDIEIDNVFRLLAEVSDLNIIVSDKVKGKVTMRLKDVPWDQALDLIISTHKLGMVKQGNVIRIAPLADLIKEEKERRRLREEKIKERLEAQKRLEEAEIERRERERKLRPFETVPIILNYTKAKDLEKQIKGFLTREPDINKVGSVIVDERTNTITITDYPEKIEFIKHYIKQVDTPTPQVLIEARIVKASKNFAREIGIQWGGQFAEFDRTGEWAWGISSGPGDASPSTWRSGAFTGNTGFDFNPFSSWMVNLPATLLGAGTPGIGFQIGRLVGDLINLDLRLSAAEAEGLTKIVSRPKIMTLDNVEATIRQGFEIPYTQVNPEGNVSVVWKKAELKTTVTPLISPDGRVHLKLEVTDDYPDEAIKSSEGEPAIRTRQAYTEVLVKNGETVVIGGILEETQEYSEEGVPGLRDIPILNWLFKKKKRKRDQTELLIFVTPFIVEET
jgi:type IV pilus assembly protein PilQ